MIDALRRILVVLTEAGERREMFRSLRRMAAAIRASSPAAIAETIAGMEALRARLEAMGASCVTIEIFERQGGRFDSADLRYWLALARHARIAHIPAREILVLSEEEANIASGEIDLSKIGFLRGLAGRLGAALELMGIERSAPPAVPSAKIDRAALAERVRAAMDDVPDGWMVRHVRAGPSTLKALAGSGVQAADGRPVAMSADVAVGPGWIREGNRRRVHVEDGRIVKVAMVQTFDGPQRFVARPWITPARYLVCEDPHRHGTPFAGKGAWPAEWRCFVHDGRVEAVTSYYAWAGQRTPHDARMALRVRALAQQLVDSSRTLGPEGAIPLHVAHELHRGDAREPEWLRTYPATAFCATLDFLETPEGPVLLEGGPCWSPAHVAHPCGFAGFPGRPQGVAFRLLPGVLLAEPSTWHSVEASDAIASWAEVEALAAA